MMLQLFSNIHHEGNMHIPTSSTAKCKLSEARRLIEEAHQILSQLGSTAEADAHLELAIERINSCIGPGSLDAAGAKPR